MADWGFYGIEYEGLREIGQALKEINNDLLGELNVDLGHAGDVVRDDARIRFTETAPGDASVRRTAEGFETRVRLGGAAHSLVSVAQGLAKTTGLRPDYGGRMMRHGFLPARTAKLDEAREILETGAFRLLKRHGF